jgi:hypothetical protein
MNIYFVFRIGGFVKIAYEVPALGEEADFEALNFIRCKKLEFSTSSRIYGKPNPRFSKAAVALNLR